MNKTILILGLFLLSGYNTIAQSAGELQYSSSENAQNFNYKEELHDIASGTRVLGLGECTHGTMECTDVRSEIVKLLVQEYNYRHFILEGGYIPCKAINEYISKGKGDLRALVLHNIAWPFAIEEFANLLEWLKSYNMGKPETEQVQFYGMDVTAHRILRTRYNEHRLYNKLSFDMDTTLLAKLETIKRDEKTRLKIYDEMLEQNSTEVITTYDSIQRNNMIQSYKCGVTAGGAGKKCREEAMYEFARFIIDRIPAGEKAVIWAHNDHLSKKYSGRPSVGEMLHKHYGDGYRVIGFGFEGGNFLANTNENGKTVMHTYTAVHYPGTIEDQLKDKNNGLLGINIGKNREHELVDKKQMINNFGAEYNMVSAGKKNFYKEHLRLSASFDYFFVIKEMHPPTRIKLTKGE